MPCFCSFANCFDNSVRNDFGHFRLNFGYNSCRRRSQHTFLRARILCLFLFFLSLVPVRKFKNIKFIKTHMVFCCLVPKMTLKPEQQQTAPVEMRNQYTDSFFFHRFVLRIFVEYLWKIQRNEKTQMLDFRRWAFFVFYFWWYVLF